MQCIGLRMEGPFFHSRKPFRPPVASAKSCQSSQTICLPSGFSLAYSQTTAYFWCMLPRNADPQTQKKPSVHEPSAGSTNSTLTSWQRILRWSVCVKCCAFSFKYISLHDFLTLESIRVWVHSRFLIDMSYRKAWIRSSSYTDHEHIQFVPFLHLNIAFRK